MHKYLPKKVKGFSVLIIVLFVTGCSPGIPPPIPPDLFSMGFGWIVVGLLLWVAMLKCKKLNSSKTTKTDRLIETLNTINQRLSALEEKINQQEREKNK